MGISGLEKELILKLFKDLAVLYNPSTVAKELKRTRVGTFKALKDLESKGIVRGKQMGKAVFYSLNLEDAYVRKNVEILLMEEARKKRRWVEEFKELYNFVEIAILFGSILRSESKAKDIDLLLVLRQENNKALNIAIESKNQILLKRIHPIKQTKQDLVENIKKKDKVILGALKHGVVLYGFEELVNLIKDGTNKE